MGISLGTLDNDREEVWELLRKSSLAAEIGMGNIRDLLLLSAMAALSSPGESISCCGTSWMLSPTCCKSANINLRGRLEEPGGTRWSPICKALYGSVSVRQSSKRGCKVLCLLRDGETLTTFCSLDGETVIPRYKSPVSSGALALLAKVCLSLRAISVNDCSMNLSGCTTEDLRIEASECIVCLM